MRKDKQKILGEVFNDEQVKTFLDGQPPEGVNLDYHLLERAYRGMNIENFETYLGFFTEAGRDLNATNPQGQTLLQIVSTHGHGEDYAAALKAKGAN